jgi:hypothetical protein
MMRLTFVLRRNPQMSRTAFQHYWREIHGPLVAKHATTLNILRYVQVHTLDDLVNDQLAGAQGAMEPPYDGVAKLWWPTREALASTVGNAASQAAAKELLEDEAWFIDLPHSPLWFAHEYPQVDPTPEELVAREHSAVDRERESVHRPQISPADGVDGPEKRTPPSPGRRRRPAYAFCNRGNEGTMSAWTRQHTKLLVA